MTSNEITALLAPWRELYETDPTVSQASIAASVGLSQRTISNYARRLGWRARSAPSVSLAPAAAAPVSSAAPSIWALAQGVGVSTARHGGKHVEVRA